jgi:tRNA (cmo5U34)-methyltransferase
MSSTDIADAFTPGTWEFTPEVVTEFDNHVRQSVPHYDLIQGAVAELSDWLAPDGAIVADLGVSTAETPHRIAQRHPARELTFIGYDTSSDMLRAAREKVPGIITYKLDIAAEELRHADADLTVSLFTLQFLPPHQRVYTLQKALDSSRAGGAILIAEKVQATDSRWFEIGAELSWDYKATAGIPSDAIRSKAASLRGVLRPLTAESILDQFQEAGWVGATCLFKWHQWCLFGAFAP